MDDLQEIQEGWTGTRQTVDAIYQLVDEGITDPLVVREARKIVINVPERDQAAESRAISAYVRRHLRYTKESCETLTSPHEMIESIHRYGKFAGDCDEAVTLWLTLHKAIGFQVEANVISQRRDKMANHIFGRVVVNGRWVTDDTIVRGKRWGWAIPDAQRTVTKRYAMDGLGGHEMIQTRQAHPGRSAWGHSRRQHERREENVFSTQGRTRLMTAAQMVPEKYVWESASLAPTKINLKPAGMLYVDRKTNQVSGVGFRPQLGEMGKFRIGKIFKAPAKLIKGLVGGKKKEKCPPGMHDDGQRSGRPNILKKVLKGAGKVAPALLLGVGED